MFTSINRSQVLLYLMFETKTKQTETDKQHGFG